MKFLPFREKLPVECANVYLSLKLSIEQTLYDAKRKVISWRFILFSPKDIVNWHYSVTIVVQITRRQIEEIIISGKAESIDGDVHCSKRFVDFFK